MNNSPLHKLLLVALALVMALAAAAGHAQTTNTQTTKPGLLILSHGAPSSQWNEPVTALVNRVREQNGKDQRFHAVEGAFLEFTQPDAAAGVEKLEAAGCDRIIVVPLFIAPSSHSHFDVPGVLGLYSSPEIRAVLEKEGARVAQPKVPLTLIQTLSEGDLLERYALDEIKALSKKPEDEAIVILAHGCPDHRQLVERMTKRVSAHCCGRTGIDYADWAYCAVGQKFWEDATPVMARAAEHKKRIIVVGLYISSSAKHIYERALRSAQGAMGTEFENPLEKVEMVLSDRGVVHHLATAQWILDAAAEALSPAR